MHKVNIPLEVVERVIRHRGRKHVYENFDPRRSALLVVDMQNAFMMPGVAHHICAEAVDIVPNINRLAAAMRNAGGMVVWVMGVFGEASLENWPVLHEMAGPERTPARIAALAPGSIGHLLWADLITAPQDLTISKTKYSAFIQGSSDLAAVLRDRGIDTVLVTGTVTNVCCESTARDAMMMDYSTIMVHDTLSAVTPEEHVNSLTSWILFFGDVLGVDEVISRVRPDFALAQDQQHQERPSLTA